MEKARVKEGENVLLFVGEKEGGGEMVVQIAKLKNAFVTVVCPPDACAAYRDLDADVVIHSQVTDVIPFLSKVSRPYDTVVDTCFSPEDAAWKSKYEGQIRSNGFLGRDTKTVTFSRGWRDTVCGLVRRLCGLDLFPLGYYLFDVDATSAAPHLETLASLVVNGRLRVFIADVYPFTEESVRAAFDARARVGLGAVVVRVTSDGEWEGGSSHPNRRKRSVTFSDVVSVNGGRKEEGKKRSGEQAQAERERRREEEEEERKYLKEMEEEKATKERN